MAALPADVTEAVANLEVLHHRAWSSRVLQAALAAVEAQADGLLSMPLAELRERLSPLDQAKTHVLLAYAINTLFYSASLPFLGFSLMHACSLS